ncbi:MAG: hypothetical protein ACI4MN_00250 [Candidatus Coproplasma sp.]
MGKTKSIVITVLLAIVMAVASFFALVSIDNGSTRVYNSILSNISLGADFTGYAYTTVCPEGVITQADYDGLVDAYTNADDEEKAKMDDPAIYVQSGNYYVNTEEYSDIDELKALVAADAKIVNARFGEKGYSSYSVAVEDGLAIKVSVPTYFTSAQYKLNADGEYYDADGREERISAAKDALSKLTLGGELTLRTSDTSISTTDSDGNSSTYDMTKYGADELVGKALVDDAKTYSLSKEDVAPYFKSVTGGQVGSTPVLTFNFTSEGREKIKEISTLVVSSSSQTLYFFIGEDLLLSFNCTSVIESGSLSLQTSDAEMARNIAITMDSAVKGNALSLKYSDVSVSTQQSNVSLAAILALVACLLLLVGLATLLIIKYKKLGAVTATIAVLMAIVLAYALQLLSITVTFAVLFTCAITIALFAVSCAVVFAEVKRLTLTGRTIQASIVEAYKNVLMTVTDIHIVLVVVSILLATVAVGEVAACGFIALVGVVASYVLYWFTRFMWYVTSSPEKDKFKFAGLKRVVYEDD